MDRFGGPTWVPKGAQNGPQNGSKSKTKINIKYEGFQVPLGSVLGPSWVVLGSILGSQIIKFHLFLQGFREHRVFDEDNAWKCILDGSWVDFDAKRGPKRLPNRPKWVPKRIQNRSKNMMDFLIDFEAVLEPPTVAPPPTTIRAGAVEGVGGGINPSPKRV